MLKSAGCKEFFLVIYKVFFDPSNFRFAIATGGF